jgi:hypothetical protein
MSKQDPDVKDIECTRGMKDAGHLMRSAFSVSAISHYLKEYFGYWCPEVKERISVVYMGRMIENGCAEARIPENPKVTHPYILSVARLVKVKGIDILVMAFAEVLKQGCDVHLILCGPDFSNGQLFPFIQRLGMEERIHWVGQLPHSQVMSLMRNSLFFVSPSRRESFGCAIVEAMQAGKTVVATRVGAVPEIVRDGVDGIVVPPRDVKALSEAMIRLVKDAKWRDSLAKEAQKRSLNFRWDHAIKTYSRMYKSRLFENQEKHHPADKIVVVIGGSSLEPGVQVTVLNFSRGLSQEGQRFAMCVQRTRWREAFRVRYPEWNLYHLGLPPVYGLKYLSATVVCAQLIWIHHVERIRVWHYYLIVYAHLKGFVWFTRILHINPIVTLA